VESGTKVCTNCKSPLAGDAVFCPDCGTYQGQPGVDEGSVPSVDPVGSPRPGLRVCPYCRMTISDIATACTNCFRSLQPTAVASGPELKPASRAFIWWIMGISVFLLVAGFAADIAIQIIAALHGHAQ
jgi:predicted amidophosphoribosyltransferase